jgi:FtsH-binding integral membrane protein
MQAKVDKLELGLIIFTGIASVFHFQGEKLGSQVMLFLGASIVLYYVMRAVLFFRAWPQAKDFALAGFGLFAYCGFMAIFILSCLLQTPEIEKKLPLLLTAAVVPALALGLLATKYTRSDWLPFVFRLIGGTLVLSIYTIFA